jgi:hypothetical protein
MLASGGTQIAGNRKSTRSRRFGRSELLKVQDARWPGVSDSPEVSSTCELLFTKLIDNSGDVFEC